MVWPNALVLAPTRELAVQIFEESLKFTYRTGIRSVVVYGGEKMDRQLSAMRKGCDMIIATPGRLIDFMERGLVGLRNIQFLILDEADRMLDMGFEPQIRRVVDESDMPSCAFRRTLMFSATFPSEIQLLSGDFMDNYVFLAVGQVGAASSDVVQKVEWVEQNDKLERLREFIDFHSDGLLLVFVETKRSADAIEYQLYRDGVNAISIHGDKSQPDREEALRLFRNGEVPILIATDVAARGLDIPNVTNVVNYDLPSNVDDYVHRIGRTGRVGNIGHALAFMNHKNDNIAKDMFELLEKHQQEIPEWLERMAMNNRGGGGGKRRGGRGGRGRGRGRGRNNARFGARDIRKGSGSSSGYRNSNYSGGGDDDNNWSRGKRGGGGGGGGRGGRGGGGGHRDNSAF